jgi:hypothetical protein
MRAVGTLFTSRGKASQAEGETGRCRRAEGWLNGESPVQNSSSSIFLIPLLELPDRLTV